MKIIRVIQGNKIVELLILSKRCWTLKENDEIIEEGYYYKTPMGIITTQFIWDKDKQKWVEIIIHADALTGINVPYIEEVRDYGGA